MNIDLKAYLDNKKGIVEKALAEFCPESHGPGADVISAMRYSLLAGGKRLRPILCMAGADTVGGDGQNVLPVACALEMIHTYSLIHDDLPAMDNDDLRRGKPTNHKVYGEATAILAGDGLLTEAFHLMTMSRFPDSGGARTLICVIRMIAEAAGYDGMVGGQAVDTRMEGKEAQLPLLDFIHSRKTGALITVSVRSGALLGGGEEDRIRAITRYGEKIGLAFQISDDILDIEGDSEKLGKAVGGDARKGKNTYPALVGLQRSKEIRIELIEAAVESLEPFDHRADPLRRIAGYIIERKK